MAGSVFRRYLEIVLDKVSAQKTERDAQATIDRATRPGLAQRNLTAFFNTAARLATQATAAIAGYAVAIAKLTERGGQVLQVQRAFSVAVGDSDAAITKLRKATGGLISDYDLMVGFNKALSLGAVTTIEQFGEMASVAQRLGKALGINATQAMENLSLGIARHSPKILDNLGITAKATDDVATILDKARARADEFGVAAETNADRINRLKTQFTNLQDELGKFLAQSDTLKIWAFEASNALDALTLALQSHDAETVKEAFKEFGALLGSLFVASFADAAAAAFRQLTFKKNGLLPSILGGALGFAVGGIPGAAVGAAGTPLAAAGLTKEMESLSDAAWSSANAQIAALDALRKQVEAAQDLRRVLNPVITQNRTAGAGGGVPSGAAPRRTMTPGQVSLGGGVSVFDLHAISDTSDAFADLVEQYRTGFQDIESASQTAALGMESAFQRAFAGLGQEGETFGSFFAEIFKGAASSALTAIAQVASAKVVENVAHAFEEIAAASASAAVGNLPGAALHTAAAHGYELAAVKWGLVGGVAAAAAGAVGGAGGGSDFRGSDVVGRQVDQLDRGGPEIHLHIDGVDPNNPRHQAALGAAIRDYQQRYGTRITVNG